MMVNGTQFVVQQSAYYYYLLFCKGKSEGEPEPLAAAADVRNRQSAFLFFQYVHWVPPKLVPNCIGTRLKMTYHGYNIINTILLKSHCNYGIIFFFIFITIEVVKAFTSPYSTFFRQVPTKQWITGELSLSLQIDFDEKEGLTFDKDGPRVHFRAQKISSQICEEAGDLSRTLLHYLALPAEQYSVLDAGTIFKKENGAPNQFTCALDPISFFGNTIVAQIDAEVDVSPYPLGKSVIRVTGCQLEGSRLARFANGSFDVSCVNVVR
jgi:hypothetical protein